MVNILKFYRTIFLICIMAVVFSLSGCDATSRHKVLTTIFDGVPSQIPPEEVLEEYYANRRQAELDAAAGLVPADGETVGRHVSRHLPYTEKKCKDCHDFSSAVGLIRPPRELCFVCHRDFLDYILEPYVHGPVAVGDCSACHLPHSSENTSLLELDRNKICDKCHHEERLAAAMHDKVMSHGMACVDCHDAHYSQARYFLK